MVWCSDCLLAMSMNSVDIPADHGYPLRAFFPAVAGARSVKWVTRLSVLPNESAFPWNSLYYKEDVNGTATSKNESFLTHFPRIFQRHPTPHVLCDVIYPAPVLIGGWIGAWDPML